MAHAFIGTSGWVYEAWRDDFYAGVPRRAWLEHCARQFSGLEVDATFYRRQRTSTLERWRDTVPDGFVFAIKAHRYITHVRRLREVTEPIRRERDRSQHLGSAFGAGLWQLPRSLTFDAERLEEFVSTLRAEWPARHAIEFRHRSWFRCEVAEKLRAHRIAVCLSDAADWPLWDEVTADFVYVRLHGHTRTYASDYRRATLERWLTAAMGIWTQADRKLDAGGHEI